MAEADMPFPLEWRRPILTRIDRVVGFGVDGNWSSDLLEN
jgi:hypothetical protein